MISNNIGYQDLGADHFLNRTDPARQVSTAPENWFRRRRHQARRLIHQLRQLGYDTVVTISETRAQ